MLLKYFVFALIVFNIANCQYVRVARQSTKGGRQPSPSYNQPQVKEPYVPSSSIGAVQRPRPRPQEEEGSVNIIPSDGEANPEPASYGGVAGTPGVDFPGYTQVPRTNFKCSDYPYEPGMYADLDTQCQAYHVCFQGRRESFLCGIGTVFNQAILACDYWYSVDCASSPNFYSVNEELGKANPEPGPGAPVQPRPPAPQPRPPAPRPSAPSVQPSFPSRPAPRPDYRPPSPSIPRPDYQQPSYEEEVEQPVPKPQPPSSQIRPSFPSRPRPVPQPPVKRPQPQPRRPSYRPQPVLQPRPQPPSYQPQPRPQQPSYKPQPRPQPPSYQPRPQPRPQPQPQPLRPLPPRPAPRPIPLPPVGKPQPPRPYRPVQPIQPPIVQRQEEEPVDDSWLAKEQEPSSQVQESY